MSTKGILGLLAFAVFYSIAPAQDAVFTKTIDLKLGDPNGAYIQLIELDSYVAVVFRYFPNTASCPWTKHGEFELKKMTPGSSAATSQHSNCFDVNTISIDTNIVWEVPTALQKTYYLQLVELLPDKKVKVRVTKEKPALGLGRSQTVPFSSADGEEYMVDGKKASSANPGSVVPKSRNVWVGPKATPKQ